ncbi:MAG: S24/S26 family peptidase [Prevotella sp.]|nr:S24/S26 family peptidase [Prevotella sp.]
MQEKYKYQVAGHVFELSLPQDDPLHERISQYAPFRTFKDDIEPVFRLQVVSQLQAGAFLPETHQDDDGSEISAGRVDGHPCFDFLLCGKWQARLLTSDNYQEGTLYAEGDRLFGLNDALMVMFALSTAEQQTLLMHASVVSYQGGAYLMLGKSGTGKSTHTHLWLTHIAGTELVNDDNPVVRIVDGRAVVYGSPWSGKTPCYRNVHYPIGAFVQLSQAPVNEIRRIKGIEAYADLVPAVSGKRWDRRIADGLHETENWIVGHVPMYHLRCLPNEEAALTCMRAVAPTVEASRLKTVDNNEAIAEVASLLKEGHKVILPVKGQSMLPFIIGSRDSVELVIPKGPLFIGDAILAWVDNCRYVLHRIIEIRADGHLVLMGDGNIAGKEYCGLGDVVARAETVIHSDGSQTPLYSRSQLFWWKVWNTLRPIRRWILAVLRRTIFRNRI